MYNASEDKAIIELLANLKGKADVPLTILEIGCGSGVRSQYLADNFPQWNVVASDLNRKRPGLLSDEVLYIHQDVHDILFKDNYFDVVFSVAVSEHYQDTEQALSEQYRVLKPGGLFYFVHTPFFSCSKGHHAHFNQDFCRIFPPYGHLYMEKTEYLKKSLARSSLFGLNLIIPDAEITRAVNRIYSRRDLSRLSHGQFSLLLRTTKFEIVQWIEVVDTYFNDLTAIEVLPCLHKFRDVSELKIEKVRCAAIKRR
jgi:ubiquinone/menaquinone biosynthesis C-methylase UbiE